MNLIVFPDGMRVGKKRLARSVRAPAARGKRSASLPFESPRSGFQTQRQLGGICRDTLSTTPISASWIASAVPP